MEIVIIDDSATTLAILRSLCAKIGSATAKGFSDPVEALDYLQSNAVALIVADYSMPRMTGIELIKRLRSTSVHKTTPIVMVSASLERAVQNRAIEVGATAFVKKPVNAKDLKACIELLMGPASNIAAAAFA